MLVSYKCKKTWLSQPQNFRLVEQFHSIFGNQFYDKTFLYIKYELRKLSFKDVSHHVWVLHI